MGAVIVCGWLTSAYCMLRPMSAERKPPRSVEIDPVTGTVIATVSLRSVLSLLPVHTSNRAFLTSPAILSRSAGDSPLDAAPTPETPIVEAFCRNVLKSLRNAATLTVAVMWVVSVPPTLSVPTTLGFCSQSSGLMPSLESVPELPPLPVEPTCERLDSSFLNVAAGS